MSFRAALDTIWSQLGFPHEEPDEPHRNGCHNQPRPAKGDVTHTAQAGWREVRLPDGTPDRQPIYVDIRHVFEGGCHYDRQADDKGCIGCKHKQD